MHPADIHAALKKAGSSWADVARSLRGAHNRPLTIAAVFNVAHGFSKSDKIAWRLSQVTGVPVAQLFPGQYARLVELQAKVQRRADRRSSARQAVELKPHYRLHIDGRVDLVSARAVA